MPLIMRGRKCRAEVEDPSDEDDEVPFAPVRQNTGMSLDAQPPEATTNTPSVALSLKYDRLEKLFRARACILVVRCPNHDHSHLPAEVEEIVLFVAKTLHGGRGVSIHGSIYTIQALTNLSSSYLAFITHSKPIFIVIASSSMAMGRATVQ